MTCSKAPASKHVNNHWHDVPNMKNHTTFCFCTCEMKECQLNHYMTVISGRKLPFQRDLVSIYCPVRQLRFEAKVDSQWSVGDIPTHFQEHCDIFPLKNVITRLFWAGKKWLRVSRLRHKGAFSSLSCIFAVCLIRGHTDPRSLIGIKGTDSDRIFY